MQCKGRFICDERRGGEGGGEEQSRETSHLGARFGQSMEKRKPSRTIRSVGESLLSHYRDLGYDGALHSVVISSRELKHEG